MEKKYELTDECIALYNGTKLYRIKALRDFGDIHKGDLGGFIEKEGNLSQYDDAWVADNAQVYDNAIISGNAQIFGNAKVYNNSKVINNVRIYDDAVIFGYSSIYENAQIYGSARVFGNAKIHGNSCILNNAYISGNANITGNAYITSNNDICGFNSFGSANRDTYAYKTIYNNIEVTCGCFHGDLEEFKNRIKKTHKDNNYGKQYKAIINIIKIKFNLK